MQVYEIKIINHSGNLSLPLAEDHLSDLAISEEIFSSADVARDRNMTIPLSLVALLLIGAGLSLSLFG